MNFKDNSSLAYIILGYCFDYIFLSVKKVEGREMYEKSMDKNKYYNYDIVACRM